MRPRCATPPGERCCPRGLCLDNEARCPSVMARWRVFSRTRARCLQRRQSSPRAGAADEVAAGREPLEEPVEVALREARAGGIGIVVGADGAPVARELDAAPARPGAGLGVLVLARRRRGSRRTRLHHVARWSGATKCSSSSPRAAASARRNPMASPAIASTSTASDGAARNDRRSSVTSPTGPATATVGSVERRDDRGHEAPRRDDPGSQQHDDRRRRPAGAPRSTPRPRRRGSPSGRPRSPRRARPGRRRRPVQRVERLAVPVRRRVGHDRRAASRPALRRRWPPPARIAPATSSVATMTTVATPTGASSSRDGTEAVEP